MTKRGKGKPAPVKAWALVRADGKVDGIAPVRHRLTPYLKSEGYRVALLVEATPPRRGRDLPSAEALAKSLYSDFDKWAPWVQRDMVQDAKLWLDAIRRCRRAAARRGR